MTHQERKKEETSSLSRISYLLEIIRRTRAKNFTPSTSKKPRYNDE